MPNAWLEIQDGPEAGKRFEIPNAADSVVLGRSPDCAIVVAAPSISRKHARLVRVGAGFRLEDLGSANGTLVNGTRVEGAVDVADQDRITLGSVAILLVCPPAASEEDATIAIPPATREAAAAPRPAEPAPQPEAPPVETPPPPPAPKKPREPGISPEAVAEATPTAPTPAPAAQSGPTLTATRAAAIARPARTTSPGLAELVAIGVGSFLAVYGLGWLLG